MLLVNSPIISADPGADSLAIDDKGNVTTSKDLSVGENISSGKNLSVGGNARLNQRLDIGGNADIGQNIKINGNVGIGTAPQPDTKLQVQNGNLKVIANHDEFKPNITEFYPANKTQSIGISYAGIHAIGSNASQDIFM